MVTSLSIPYGLYVNFFAPIRVPAQIAQTKEEMLKVEHLGLSPAEKSKRIKSLKARMDKEESEFWDTVRETPVALLERSPQDQIGRAHV